MITSAPAIVNSFDTSGSFGLSSNISNPPGVLSTTTAPRFHGNLYDSRGPFAGRRRREDFPATPDPAASLRLVGESTTRCKNPYSHMIDFAVHAPVDCHPPPWRFPTWGGLRIACWCSKTLRCP